MPTGSTLENVLEQRNRPEAVRTFLEKHDASGELLAAVDEAIGNLKMWIDDELLAENPQTDPSIA